MANAMSSPPLIILDRDGVINVESNAYIKTPEEWIPLPGSLEAIAAMHHAGFHIAVATNQSGIARGLFTQETLEAIHQKMLNAVIHAGGKIDAIFYCPHAPSDQCSCRKPRPGLLHQIAQHFNLSLENIPFVGDNVRDIEAACAAQAIPILVKTGNGILAASQLSDVPNILIFDNLQAVATYFIHHAFMEKK